MALQVAIQDKCGRAVQRKYTARSSHATTNLSESCEGGDETLMSRRSLACSTTADSIAYGVELDENNEPRATTPQTVASRSMGICRKLHAAMQVRVKYVRIRKPNTGCSISK